MVEESWRELWLRSWQGSNGGGSHGPGAWRRQQGANSRAVEEDMVEESWRELWLRSRQGSYGGGSHDQEPEGRQQGVSSRAVEEECLRALELWVVRTV